ncbi:Acyltransferase [Cooperia oncophora]
MSSLLTGFVGEKRVPSAPYKHLPVHPLISPAVDFSFRNICRVRPSCANCFPQTSEDLYHNYVDLFDFSKFGGMPYPILPGARPPSPWFADFRYTIVTPLPHSYPNVYEEVIASRRVAAVMKTEEAKSPNISKKAIKKKVVAFYYEIRATLSRFICKICGYLLFKVFRRLMTRLLISPLQMKRIVEAEKTGIPLVYLPLHRSHLDYLLITWTAWHFGLRLPHIASGDNLNLSGLGWLLRSTGAFFIRRRTDEHDEGGKDACYRWVYITVYNTHAYRLLPVLTPVVAEEGWTL